MSTVCTTLEYTRNRRTSPDHPVPIRRARAWPRSCSGAVLFYDPYPAWRGTPGLVPPTIFCSCRACTSPGCFAHHCCLTVDGRLARKRKRNGPRRSPPFGVQVCTWLCPSIQEGKPMEISSYLILAGEAVVPRQQSVRRWRRKRKAIDDTPLSAALIIHRRYGTWFCCAESTDLALRLT